MAKTPVHLWYRFKTTIQHRYVRKPSWRFLGLLPWEQAKCASDYLQMVWGRNGCPSRRHGVALFMIIIWTGDVENAKEVPLVPSQTKGYFSTSLFSTCGDNSDEFCVSVSPSGMGIFANIQFRFSFAFHLQSSFSRQPLAHWIQCHARTQSAVDIFYPWVWRYTLHNINA